ncbi:MAG: M16 family metallopeptidase [Anaerolineae bacterium]
MYQKSVLDNGLRILTSAMPHTRSVSIGFFIGVGSRYELDEQSGVSHFIEHMLFKGTAKRPTAREIAVAIEGVGGVFNAGTGTEASLYWAKVAQPHLDIAIDVLVDMLRHSRFEPGEINKERLVIVEEINLTHDTPDSLVHLLINDLVWPNHPLGRDVAGTKESLSALDREGLLAYLKRHYQPSNTVVSVAGNVEHEAVVGKIAAFLGDWATGEAASYRPAEDNQAEPRLRIHHRETEQAHLCLSVPGIPRDHPDRFKLRLLNTVLGEGMSSRLFTEIREKRGLAYSIYSYASGMHDAGAVGVYAGVDPRRIEDAIKAILAEWDRLRQESVAADELAKVKEFVKGRLLLQMEDSFSVAAWLGRQEVLSPEVLTVDEVIEALDAVTAADIQGVAQGLFLGERLNLAVVGPFEEEEEFRELLAL